MATIGKIAIVMAANTSPLQKGLSKAATAVSRWERASSRSLGRSTRAFRDGFSEALKAANRLNPQYDEVRKGLGKMGGAARKAFKPLVGLTAIKLARWASAGVSAIGSLAGSLFKVVGILGAVSTGTAIAVGWIGVKLAKAAIHFGESVGTVQGFFGDQADAVLDDAKNLQRAAGISRKEYLDSAAALNELFANTGLADRDTADLSRSFAKLAADSAAFRDSDFATEFDKISRALQGSTRALRAYGIDLSGSAIKEEAVRLGLIKKGQEIGQVSDRLARASLIQQGLARDAGELGRAFDSPRNQLAALAGRWEDLKVAIGEKLIPALKGPLNWLNSAIVAFGDNLDTIEEIAREAFTAAKNKAWEFGSSLIAAFAAGKPLIESVADTIASMVDILDRAQATFKFMYAHAKGAAGVVKDLFRTTPYTEEELANKGSGFDGALAAIDNLGKFGDKIRNKGKELANLDVSSLITDAVKKAQEAVEKTQKEIAKAASKEAKKPRDWKSILESSKEESEDKAKKPSRLFGEALTFGSAAAVSSILRSRYGAEKDNPVAKNTRETAQGVKEAVKAINRLRHGGNRLAIADF